MSYRKKLNAADLWTRFSKSTTEELHALGIPRNVVTSEARFTEFLAHGVDNDADVPDLTTITDSDFLRLEKIVNQYFPDEQDQAPMCLFRSERLRRFNRYA